MLLGGRSTAGLSPLHGASADNDHHSCAVLMEACAHPCRTFVDCPSGYSEKAVAALDAKVYKAVDVG